MGPVISVSALLWEGRLPPSGPPAEVGVPHISPSQLLGVWQVESSFRLMTMCGSGAPKGAGVPPPP